MHHVKLSIRGEDWDFYWCGDEDWNHHGDPDARAICKADDNAVFFCLKDTNEAIVTHELFHVLNSTLFLSGADATIEQMEEVQANFFERFLTKYVELVDILTKETIKAYEQSSKA